MTGLKNENTNLNEIKSVLPKIENVESTVEFLGDIPSNDQDQEISERKSVIRYSGENPGIDQQIEQNFGITSVCRPITDYKNNLNEVEGNYLTELFKAIKVLKTPMGPVATQASNYFEAKHVMNSALIIDAIRYVSMSRSLMAFNNICPNDRSVLLRPGIPEMLTLRYVKGYFHENDKEYFIVPTVSILHLHFLKYKTHLI